MQFPLGLVWLQVTSCIMYGMGKVHGSYKQQGALQAFPADVRRRLWTQFGLMNTACEAEAVPSLWKRRVQVCLWYGAPWP